jgi:hypothetical protein
MVLDKEKEILICDELPGTSLDSYRIIYIKNNNRPDHNIKLMRESGFIQKDYETDSLLFYRRQISLCIPTKDRWSFLKENIPKYLNNPYVHEIIITDETGNDKRMIEEYIKSPRIKVYANDRCLKPFFNKRKVVSLASLPFVCLMDSDNFADIDYFHAWAKYLDGKEPDNSTIYSPTFTKPQSNHPGFHFEYLNNIIINKDNFKNVFKKTDVIFNLGNYIVPRELFNSASPTIEEETIFPLPIDVICQNYIIISRCGGSIAMVPNMSYNHIVHPGSFYTVSCAGAGVSHENINKFYR